MKFGEILDEIWTGGASGRDGRQANDEATAARRHGGDGHRRLRRGSKQYLGCSKHISAAQSTFHGILGGAFGTRRLTFHGILGAHLAPED